MLASDSEIMKYGDVEAGVPTIIVQAQDGAREKLKWAACLRFVYCSNRTLEADVHKTWH